MSPRKDAVDGQPMRPLEFLVLAVLQDGPLHGYGIVQEVAKRTADRIRIRPGNLYRVLDRMMERGSLAISARRPARRDDDERRTYYQITPVGRRSLTAEAEMLANVATNVLDRSPRHA